MPEINIDTIHFFIFVIPGAITVWAFRYFRKSKKMGDFEYLALSAFWGLMMLATLSFFIPEEAARLLKNPYALALSFSIVGLFGSFFSVSLLSFGKE